MRELPIIFSGPMVRAIFAGNKTMTRRMSGLKLINEHPDWWERAIQLHDGTWSFWAPDAPNLQEFALQVYPEGDGIKSRYQVEDHLYIKETWQAVHFDTDPETGLSDNFYAAERIPEDNADGFWTIVYAAEPGWDSNKEDRGFAWRPSIFMPKWAARIWLEVTNVRCERVQDITEEDAGREGMTQGTPHLVYGYMAGPIDEESNTLVEEFERVWDSIHGPGAWECNDWVFVYEFRRIER